MLAVHLQDGRVEVCPREEPACPPGFAKIRLLLGGICNTDLELQRGYYSFSGTPGHEFVGQVIESGKRSLVGKRVVGDINLACGHCTWCTRRLRRHCPNRTVLGIVKHPGAFQEVFTLPEQNLHVVPPSITDEEAVFVEPLAAACEILDQVKLPRGRAIAVLGDGKLGLLVAQVLHAHGAAVHHYGRHAAKLALSAACGIATFSGSVTAEERYPLVVDATGSPDGLAQAASMTGPRGTLVMKSTVHDKVPVDTAPLIVNELTLVGSRCGRFAPALRLLRQGKVDVRPLIHGEFPLAQAPHAFARAAEKGVLKILLRSGL